MGAAVTRSLYLLPKFLIKHYYFNRLYTLPRIRLNYKAVPADIIQFASHPKHNICAYLDPTTKYAKDFSGIITFLRRSSIHYAILTPYDAYRSHQNLFWNTARVETIDGVKTLSLP